MIGNLPTQPVTAQLNRVCDAKVEEATFGMQRNISLPLNKTSPVTTLGDPVATNPHNDQIRTSSQLLTKLTEQSSSQSYTDPRDYVPQSKTFTSSEAHSREYVSRSETVTSSGVYYVPIRETVTRSEAPQTISCAVQHARLYNPPQITYPFQYPEPPANISGQYPRQIDPPVNTSVPRMPSRPNAIWNVSSSLLIKSETFSVSFWTMCLKSKAANVLFPGSKRVLKATTAD